MEYTYEKLKAAKDISDIDSKKIDLYTELIPSFSEQVEDYEKRNYGECMTCIAFIGALLTMVCACLTVAVSSEKDLEKGILNGAIAFILMLIPVVITIFLYNFAMNCRRSAILRGYLQFLESRINEIFKDVSMLYHGQLYASEIVRFPVNKYGPLALGLALLAVYAVCCYFSYHFSQNLRGSAADAYWIYFGAVLAICTLFSILFVVALTRNDEAVQRSKLLCEEFYKDNCLGEDDKRAMEEFEHKLEEYKDLYFCLHEFRLITCKELKEKICEIVKDFYKNIRRW